MSYVTFPHPQTPLPSNHKPGGVLLLKRSELGSIYFPQEGGVKHDEGKLPYDLIPPELLSSVAKVLQFGAKKYAPRNWEQGMDWGRVFSALQRHLWAWQNKEQADPETGFSHLEHAACCVAFLLTYEQRGVGKDDR